MAHCPRIPPPRLRGRGSGRPAARPDSNRGPFSARERARPGPARDERAAPGRGAGPARRGGRGRGSCAGSAFSCPRALCRRLLRSRQSQSAAPSPCPCSEAAAGAPAPKCSSASLAAPSTLGDTSTAAANAGARDTGPLNMGASTFPPKAEAFPCAAAESPGRAAPGPAGAGGSGGCRSAESRAGEVQLQGPTAARRVTSIPLPAILPLFWGAAAFAEYPALNGSNPRYFHSQFAGEERPRRAGLPESLSPPPARFLAGKPLPVHLGGAEHGGRLERGCSATPRGRTPPGASSLLSRGSLHLQLPENKCPPHGFTHLL